LLSLNDGDKCCAVEKYSGFERFARRVFTPRKILYFPIICHKKNLKKKIS
jgi:hypothetical protein